MIYFLSECRVLNACQPKLNLSHQFASNVISKILMTRFSGFSISFQGSDSIKFPAFTFQKMTVIFFLPLHANGCSYVECEKGIEIPYQVPTEPDFFILFLNFIAKAKSKNLAMF